MELLMEKPEETFKVIKKFRLGNYGTGTINPSDRIKNNEITDDIIEQLISDIPKYTRNISAGQIPKWCIDGRPDSNNYSLAPSASGGTYSLVIADALIDAPQITSRGTNCINHADTIFKKLVNKGLDIGDHTSDHTSGELCGCGACDKLADILAFMHSQTTTITDLANLLGVDINNTTVNELSKNAKLLLDNNYVCSGKDMINTIIKNSDKSHIQVMEGDHKEVLLVINTVNDVVIDRHAILQDYGSNYELFVLDAWALQNGIKAIEPNPEKANQKFLASVSYNIATTAVLAGPSLRVVVLA